MHIISWRAKEGMDDLGKCFVIVGSINSTLEVPGHKVKRIGREETGADCFVESLALRKWTAWLSELNSFGARGQVSTLRCNWGLPWVMRCLFPQLRSDEPGV